MNNRFQRIRECRLPTIRAALLALSGGGLVGPLAETVEMTVKVVVTRQPDLVTQAKYDEYYQIYQEAYFAQLPFFEKTARIE